MRHSSERFPVAAQDYTLPKAPENRPGPKRKVSQTPFFRGENLSVGECIFFAGVVKYVDPILGEDFSIWPNIFWMGWFFYQLYFQANPQDTVFSIKQSLNPAVLSGGTTILDSPQVKHFYMKKIQAILRHSKTSEMMEP